MTIKEQMQHNEREIKRLETMIEQLRYKHNQLLVQVDQVPDGDNSEWKEKYMQANEISTEMLHLSNQLFDYLYKRLLY